MTELPPPVVPTPTTTEPRLAATVLLLRPLSVDRAPLRQATRRPFEVYLVRRAKTMAFAADMYAFPGGTVDPRDAATDLAWVAPPNRLGLPEDVARAVVCAAVREVFEETGVLLAGPSAGTVSDDVSTVDWEERRRAVEAREVGFAELLRGQGLVLRGDLLAAWSRWITPEGEPRRYDTYFFAARLPDGQRTRHVGAEASHGVWAAPGDTGDLPMLPPTRVTLAQLAECSTVDGAMNAAAHRDAVHPVRPRFVDGRLVF